MPRTFCISCGKQIPPEEVKGTTKESYCYDCAASEVAVGEDSVPLPPGGVGASEPPGTTRSQANYDEFDESEEDEDWEDEPPDWLPDRLEAEERSWIRERGYNFPPAGFVVGALFVVAWLTLILGLLASVGAGVATADCEETLFESCENATRDGYIVFGVGAGSTILVTLILWGFAHLLDLNLESRERLEDLYFEQVKGGRGAGQRLSTGRRRGQR